MKSDPLNLFDTIQRIVTLIFLGFCTAISIPFWLLKPADLKNTLDLLAADGKIERITPMLLAQIRPLAVVLSLLFLGLFILLLLRKSLLRQGTHWFTRQIRLFWRDARHCFTAGISKLKQKNLWPDLIFLLLLAGILRFFWLERPLEHDEAFTYYVFARLPLRYAIADYSYANNHIFHTLLLKLSVTCFGNHSWAMRLPAFLFGTVTAPLLYLFARTTTHQRRTALLAGGLAALFPYMIYYSANARGYSLLTAFTLLALILAYTAMQYKNRLVWILFCLAIIAGLYTMPIMLLPAGGIYTWLFLCEITGKFSSAYKKWDWLIWLFFSGLLVVLGTLLVYLPVIQYSGIHSLIANPNVAPLSPADFLPTFHDRLKDIWKEWQSGFSLWFTLPAAAIMILGIFHYEKKSCVPVSVFFSMMLFLILYTALQRPNLWPRVVYYLVPLIMLALAFGVQAIGHLFHKHFFKHTPIPQWMLPMGLVLIAILMLLQTPNASPLGKRVMGETENTAGVLAQLWQPDQLILIDYPEDMPFNVYMERQGLPASAVRWETPFRGAYVIVNTAEGQSLTSVIQNRGPELAFFDLDSARIIQQYPQSRLIYVPSHWNIVQKAYAQTKMPGQ